MTEKSHTSYKRRKNGRSPLQRELFARLTGVGHKITTTKVNIVVILHQLVLRLIYAMLLLQNT